MFKSIKTKLLIYILPVVVVTILLSFYASAESSRKILNTEIEEKMRALQGEQTVIVEQSLQQILRINKDMSLFVTNTYKTVDIEVYETILKSITESKDFILGIGIFFEPNAYYEDEELFSTYAYSVEGKNYITYDYSSPDYNYLEQDFYQLTKARNETVLTDSYYNDMSDTYVITCSTPFYDVNGDFLGVVEIDIRLASLNNFISRYNDPNTSLFLTNANGVFISHRNFDYVKEHTSIMEIGNDSFREASQIIMTSNNGVQSYVDSNGEKYRLYYNTVNDLGWKVVFTVPESSIVKPIIALSYQYALIGILAVLILTFTIMYVMDRYIDKPVKVLVDEFDKISNNSYDILPPLELVNNKDEFGLLGNELSIMKINLRHYQSDLENLITVNNKYSIELKEQNEILVENQEKLSAALQYNEAIVKAMPELMFVISKDGYCTDCQGDISIQDKPSEFFIGRHISETLESHIVDKTLSAIENVVEYNTVQSYGFELIVNDKREYYDVRMAECQKDSVLLITRCVTQFYENLNEIEYLSYHDQVTGLFNRRFYEESLIRYIDSERFPLSIIACDLNGLKLVNDSFGHDAGDELLNKFGIALGRLDINPEFISRVGGDEFTILLPNTDTNEANKLVEELKVYCDKEFVFGVKLSAAYGVNTMYSSSEDIIDFIKIADENMYKHKAVESPKRKAETVDLIIKALYDKTPKEKLHAQEVALISEKIATKLNMPMFKINEIKQTAYIHDIGKISTPDEIINKKGVLTDAEKEIFKKHTEVGYRILESSGAEQDVCEIVLCHHEMLDGSGYPRQLKGDEIPIESRIIAVADFYDYIINNRNTHTEYNKSNVINELMKNTGTKFDENIVRIFIDEVLEEL